VKLSVWIAASAQNDNTVGEPIDSPSPLASRASGFNEVVVTFKSADRRLVSIHRIHM
jgi:hypothetical protein